MMKNRTALLLGIGIILASLLFFVYFPQLLVKKYLSKRIPPVSALASFNGSTFPIDSLLLLHDISQKKDSSQAKKIVTFVSPHCPYCLNYLENLEEVEPDFEHNIRFFPIFKDSLLSDTFKQKMNYALYSANGINVAKKVRQVPTFFFLDENNKVIATKVGAPSSQEELRTLFKDFLSHADNAGGWQPASANQSCMR